MSTVKMTPGFKAWLAKRREERRSEKRKANAPLPDRKVVTQSLSAPDTKGRIRAKGCRECPSRSRRATATLKARFGGELPVSIEMWLVDHP